MNYTLHQLRVFLEVVRLKNITRAAEEMHMTQPALSIQLKNFQMQFDVPLTEVINKRIFITDFGQEIAVIAENILREAEALEFRTKEYKGLLAGKLKISSASTGKYVIPYFLSGFLKNNPGIDLVLDVTNKTKVINDLRENNIDFALVSLLPSDLKVNQEPLLDNKLYLVGATKRIEKNKPLIFREEGSATRILMEKYYGRQKGRKKFELTSNEAVKQAVLADLGYSVISLLGIKNELNNRELQIIPSPGLPIINKWRLIWIKDKLSPIAAAYLDYIRLHKKEIIEKNFKWYLTLKPGAKNK